MFGIGPGTPAKVVVHVTKENGFPRATVSDGKGSVTFDFLGAKFTASKNTKNLNALLALHQRLKDTKNRKGQVSVDIHVAPPLNTNNLVGEAARDIIRLEKL